MISYSRSGFHSAYFSRGWMYAVLFVFFFNINLSTTHASEPSIGIIGAGMSGLFTAYELVTKHGIDGNTIDIFEKESLPAGTVNSFFIEETGVTLDLGTIVISKYLNYTDSTDLSITWTSTFIELMNKYQLWDEIDNVYLLGLDVSNPDPNAVNLISFASFVALLNPPQLFSDILKYLTIFDTILSLPNGNLIKDINTFLLQNNGQSIYDWSNQPLLNISQSVTLSAFAQDTVSAMAPAFSTSAASYLRLDTTIRPSLFRSFLKNVFGLTSDAPILTFFPFIQALLNDDNEQISTVFDFFTFDKGWQKFFNLLSDDLINNYGVNIHYNSQVQQLKIQNNNNNNNKKKICCGPGTSCQEFDFVFVSSRPQDTIEYFGNNDGSSSSSGSSSSDSSGDSSGDSSSDSSSDDSNSVGDYVSQVLDLLSPENFDPLPYFLATVVVFNNDDQIPSYLQNNVPTSGDFVAYWLYPQSFFAGTVDNVENLFNCVPYIVGTNDNGRSVQVGAYVSRELSSAVNNHGGETHTGSDSSSSDSSSESSSESSSGDENNDIDDQVAQQCVSVVVDYLHNYLSWNVTVEDNVRTYKLWKNYPARVTIDAENDGWYQDIDSLQGENGIFFIGEMLSQLSVHSVLDWIDKKLPQFVHAMSLND